MRTAIEQAGAERGLLLLRRSAEQRIEAEATTTCETVTVQLRDEPVADGMLPVSVLHYVLRTRESVVSDDAAVQTTFAEDPYIRQRRTRSILCMPLLNQAKLTGVLYLENNLAPRVFAPARIAVLKLLASQAAIALEKSRSADALREMELALAHANRLETMGQLTASIAHGSESTDRRHRNQRPGGPALAPPRPTRSGRSPASARPNRSGTAPERAPSSSGYAVSVKRRRLTSTRWKSAPQLAR